MKKKYLQLLKSSEKRSNKNNGWILLITILSFVISLGFSFIAETIMPGVNITIGIIIVLLFVLIGVMFDMVGVAVAAADAAPFHSMASQKIKGASLAIKMIKNASKVSSFFNDVIGDICGIISGSTGVSIAIKLADYLNKDPFFITLLVTAIIAALTIGGKACGKNVALNKSNIILYETAKILSILF